MNREDVRDVVFMLIIMALLFGVAIVAVATT
jgi:hypothetical protein